MSLNEHPMRLPGRVGVAVVSLAVALTSSVSGGWAANAEPTIAPAPPGPTAPAANAVLVDFGDPGTVAGWATVNDPVMGGRSTSQVAFADGGLRFSGTISLENNGGFASARGPVDPGIGQKAAGATALRVRATGDGKTYLLKVGAAGQPWSYIQRFATSPGVSRTYELPIAGFEAVGFRLDPAPYAPQTLDPSSISQVAVYILDKQEGPFAVTIGAIERA